MFGNLLFFLYFSTFCFVEWEAANKRTCILCYILKVKWVFFLSFTPADKSGLRHTAKPLYERDLKLVMANDQSSLSGSLPVLYGRPWIVHNGRWLSAWLRYDGTVPCRWLPSWAQQRPRHVCVETIAGKRAVLVGKCSVRHWVRSFGVSFLSTSLLIGYRGVNAALWILQTEVGVCSLCYYS